MRGPAGSHQPQHASPRGPSFPVPALLPDDARTLLPWARAYTERVARSLHVSHSDVWDETLSALVRAHAFFKPGAGSFAAYAKTAVCRALSRYVLRSHRTHHRLHSALGSAHHTHPSAETLAALAEAAAAL